ncbi:MAG: adenylate/guanylate cyclase domain-containing protein [Alphaproteobacteria bacterium]|nr:adenylate/guanylate cyclase domain-containing protein [Alphaproteobacteria bacterium]MCW5741410.1 adenylate/guanylate cyclase domain-containing protein [Alphaproteobacteria bacterium]
MIRRLSTLLHGDLVGFSRMMEAAETTTVAAVKWAQTQVWEPAIERGSGRLVNTAGDAFLVEFDTTPQAIRCAMEIQADLAWRQREVPAERRLTFRIGINRGEVRVDGTNIFGTAVNVAARLQSLASPGTIFVSAVVRQEMGEPLGFTFTDRGELSLKNIARPVRVYEIVVDAAGHVRTQIVRERWRVVGRRRNGGPIDVTLDAAALATAEGIIVGRVPEQCHLTIDDISVSRRHFRLRQLSGETLSVEDLGSTNGTIIAGRRLTPGQPVPITAGTSVTFGDVTVNIARVPAGGESTRW